MKLYKITPTQHAARINITDGIDMDITVTDCPMGKSTTIITICRSDYPGTVMCHNLDGFEISQYINGEFVAANIIEQGIAKLSTMAGRPTAIRIRQLSIPLSYK